MYKKTYTDIIRDIKKRQKNQEENTTYELPFTSHLKEFQTLPIINDDMWFKRAIPNSFQLTLPNETKQTDKLNIANLHNLHKDLFGNDGYLATLFSISNPIDDFLTGCYFAYLTRNILHVGERFQIYVVGATKADLFNGLSHMYKKFRLSHVYFGTDNKYPKPMPNNYLNGIRKIGDVTNPNDVTSISIQIVEKLNNLLINICDVLPKTIVQLYLMFALLLNGQPKNISIMRLPDVDAFSSVHMVNFFVLVQSLFNDVKTYHVTWTSKPKYYMIFGNCKVLRKDKYRNRIIKYVEYQMHNVDTMLFDKKLIVPLTIPFTIPTIVQDNKMEIDTEEKVPNNDIIDDWEDITIDISYVTDVQNNYTNEEINALWIDLIDKKM